VSLWVCCSLSGESVERTADGLIPYCLLVHLQTLYHPGTRRQRIAAAATTTGNSTAHAVQAYTRSTYQHNGDCWAAGAYAAVLLLCRSRWAAAIVVFSAAVSIQDERLLMKLLSLVICLWYETPRIVTRPKTMSRRCIYCWRLKYIWTLQISCCMLVALTRSCWGHAARKWDLSQSPHNDAQDLQHVDLDRTLCGQCQSMTLYR
jgi:hypothetical protein